jgi:hypothetical protein
MSAAAHGHAVQRLGWQIIFCVILCHHDGHQVQVDLSRSTFVAAAFVLAARKRKVRVDSRRIIEQLGAPRSDFNCVCEDMKVCSHFCL